MDLPLKEEEEEEIGRLPACLPFIFSFKERRRQRGVSFSYPVGIQLDNPRMKDARWLIAHSQLTVRVGDRSWHMVYAFSTAAAAAVAISDV